MKKNIIVFLGLTVLILFYFWGLWQTYFQQDEWNGFGVVIMLAHQPISAWFNLATSIHFFPLNTLTWLLMYKIYGFNAQYYALTAIVLHVFASFLVYIFTKKLSKSYVVGLLSAILFATNSRASEAVIHLAVFSNTIPFFIFVMCFLIYLNNLTRKTIYGIKEGFLLGLVFLCAVFFREDAFILLPTMPVFLFFYARKILSKQNIPFFLTFYGISIGYFIYRTMLQLITPRAEVVTSHTFFKIYFYNVITFPIKLIVQNALDGYHSIESFLFQYSTWFYPQNISPEIINSVFFDLSVLIIFNLFVFVFYLLTRRVKNRLFWKNIYFALFLILVDACMLALVGRRMGMIEERYLYFSGFAVIFIFSLLFVGVYKQKGQKVIKLLEECLLTLVVLCLLSNSYISIQSNIKLLQNDGKIREKIISDIVKIHPKISKDTIFFIKCSKLCYKNSGFGIPDEVVLPFSSGPGWIILLQYAKNNETAYSNFFNYNNDEVVWNWQLHAFQKTKVSQFLWDTGSQGYRKVGNYSFGYFTDINLLKQTIEKEKIDKKIVIGLEYNEKSFTMKDISQEIQKELK